MRFLISRRLTQSIFYLVLIASANTVSCLRADILQWDTGVGTAGVQDGGGNWQVGSGNWLNQTTTTPDVVWTDGNDAVFGGGTGAAGTVTLLGPISAKSITFDAPGSGTYTIAGNVLTIVDGLITANASASITSVINGNAGLTKAGAGVLTLGGASANTYSGTATVGNGILLLSKTAGQHAITGNVDITGGGKLRFGANNQIADSSAVTVSGSGSVFNGDGVNSGVANLNETIGSLTVAGGTVNTGTGTTGLVVSGVASFTGGATSAIFLGNSGSQASANELRITGMNAIAGGNVGTANSFTVYGNSTSVRSTLTVGGGGLFLDGSTLNLRQGGAGAMGSRLVLNGDLTTLGTTASRINLDTAGGATGSVGVELSSTAGVVNRTFNTGANLSINVGLGNGAATTASIVKTGAGTLTLSALNSFNGTTTVQQGGMILDGASGRLFNTTALTLTGGSSFQNGSATAATNSGISDRISSTASLTLEGSTFTHAVTTDGNSHSQTLASLTIAQGASTINANGTTGTNTLAFTGAGGGGYVRQARGMVNFNNTGLTFAFTNAPTAGGGSSVSGGANAILVGATLNGRDFIAAQAGTLTAATYVPTGTTDWVTGANMDVTGSNPAPYAATSINSLRYNTPGAFTVTLAGTHTIDSGMILVTDQVGANASTLTGGALRGSLNGELIVFQNNLGSARMFTIGSNIEDNGGATGLTKAGLGILSLTGVNTYAGQTYVSEGVLRAVDGVGLSSGSNLLLTGGIFAPGSVAEFTRALGAGAGEIQLSGPVTGFTAVGNAATINLGGASGTLQWGSAFFNPMVLVLNDANADNAIEFKNGLDLDGAVRTITTTAAPANAATISGIISNSTGTAGLIKTGAGTLILSGVNTYGGTTTLSQGILAAGHNSAFGTSTVVLNTGTLQAAGGPRTVANNFVLAANSTVSGTNSLAVTGSFTFGADGNDITNSMTGGAIFELAGNVYLANSETSSFVAEFFGSGTTLVSGVIANNSGNNTLASHVFFNNGTGTLRLTGINTYTGRTLTAGGGAIAISQDRNLGQVPVSLVVDSIILAGSGRLRIEETFALDVNRSIGIGNSSGGAATGTIEVITDKTFTVNGTIANRTVNPNGSATTGSPNVGSLTKTGNGVLVLGGTNTYSGTTTVSAGVLRVSSAPALGATSGGTAVSSGAHLELMDGVTVTGETLTLSGSGRSAATPGSPDVNRGALQAAAGATATWAGNIILNNATTRIGTQAGGTLIVSGVIDDGANNFALQVGGDINNGTVILSGANTYGDGVTASTQVARGVLKLGAHNTLPTVTTLDIHFATNSGELATVDLNGYNQTVTALLSSNGTASNALLTNSSATHSTFTIAQEASNSYAGQITGNLSLIKNGAGAQTLSGAISTTGSVTVNNGTLTLSGVNTYTGDTIVNGGTLVLAGGSAIPDGAGKGNLHVNGGDTAGGSVNLNNVNETINGLNGSSGTVLGRIFNNATNTTVRTVFIGADGGNGSYAGQILDNTGGAALGRVGISRIGRGTQTFTGTNSSTGPIAAYNGSMVFDYAANPDLVSGQQLVLRNGHVTFKGNASGVTSDSIGTILTGSTTNSRIVVDNNGGAGTTITADNSVGWTTGTTTSSIYFDLSSGGVFKTNNAFLTTDANSVSLKNGILMNGTAASANSFRGVYFVQDATGIGFATQNASNELVRYTGATTATATSNSSTTNFIMSADLNHAGTAFGFSTLQIDTGSTFTLGESMDLSMGASNLLSSSAFNGHSVLITGANNSSITGTGAVQNSLFIANHGTGAFTLDMSMNGQAIVNIGSGLTIYNKSNVPGDVYAAGGVLRFTQDMSYTLNVVRIYGGGVLELGADLNGADTGAFNRAVGTGAGNVALIGNGGFSAFGATRVVTLGGASPASLTWGASNFLTSSDGTEANQIFMLGSSTSNATLEFTNNISLGSRTRTIDVGNGVNANDVDARLTGVLSSTAGALEKIGAGTLEITGANTYGMGTTIAAGTFLANNTTGSAAGTGQVVVQSGAKLGGTGTVTASTGTRNITVDSGATLMVGSTHTVSTGSGGVASALSLQTSAGGVITLGGTVQLDLFGNTNNGSGTNPSSDSDLLRLTSETSVVVDGILAIVDTTNASLTWGLGATWQLIDWSAVSAAVHNSGSFDDILLPTLNTGLTWDTSKLYIDGTISVAGVVPEPGRALLLLAGVMTLVMRHRRSRV